MEKQTKIIEKTDNSSNSKAWIPWLILGIIVVLIIGIVLGIAARDKDKGPAEELGENIDEKINDISSAPYEETPKEIRSSFIF